MKGASAKPSATAAVGTTCSHCAQYASANFVSTAESVPLVRRRCWSRYSRLKKGLPLPSILSPQFIPLTINWKILLHFESDETDHGNLGCRVSNLAAHRRLCHCDFG